MTHRVVPMEPKHVASVAELHARAFPRFFLTSLGTRFLRRLYSSLVESDDGIGYIVRDPISGLVAGMVAGTVGDEESYSAILRQRVWAFGLAAVPSLVLHPWLVPRLLRRVRSSGPPPPEGNLAYLASIAVDPDSQESGMGRALIDTWSADIRERSLGGFYLTTDAEDNEAVLAFYERCGMRRESSFQSFEDRPMHRYVLEFD